MRDYQFICKPFKMKKKENLELFGTKNNFIKMAIMFSKK